MRSKSLIWVLEDDETANFIYQELIGKDNNLIFFKTLAEFSIAVDKITKDHRPALIIADITLPDGSFADYYLSSSNKVFKRIPTVIISSTEATEVLFKCYDEGAVDYLTKPFNRSQLAAKLYSLIDLKKKQPFEIEVDTLKLKRNGQEAKLTPKEIHVLLALKQAPDYKMNRDEILKEVWDTVNVGKKTLDVHLFHLRQKVKHTGIKIKYRPPNAFQMLCDGMDEPTVKTPEGGSI